MTVTNPWDPTGTNPFGRWFYGPWFNPPTPTCVNGGPVDASKSARAESLPSGCLRHGSSWCWLHCSLGTALQSRRANPSIPGESFLDTMIVNGTAYPVLKVDPKAYRFRILSAGNDRALNLQLYVAADNTTSTTAVP